MRRAIATALLLTAQPVVAEPFNYQVAYLDVATRFAVEWCSGFEVNEVAKRQAIRTSGMSAAALANPPRESGVHRLITGLLANKRNGCRKVWRDFGPNGFIAPGILLAHQTR